MFNYSSPIQADPKTKDNESDSDIPSEELADPPILQEGMDTFIAIDNYMDIESVDEPKKRREFISPAQSSMPNSSVINSSTP